MSKRSKQGELPPSAQPNEAASKPLIVNLLGVTYNTDNYGVRVLLSASVENLVKRNQDVHIQILDYGHKATTWREDTPSGAKDVPLINLRFSWKVLLRNNVAQLLLVAFVGRLIPIRSWRIRWWSRNPWLQRILAADVSLALAGGDSFGNTYGAGRLLYVVLPQLLISVLGGRLVLLPQTYGPFDSLFSRSVAKLVLRFAAIVYARDVDSGRVAASLLGRRAQRVRVSPDLGLSMSGAPPDGSTVSQLADLRRSGVLVGLNVSSLLAMGGYSRNNMFGLLEDYRSLVDSVLDTILRDTDWTVLLVPHIYGGKDSEESEIQIHRELCGKYRSGYPDRIVFLEDEFSHKQVKAVIGECDLFIGARMHACIAAVSQGVATVCLAYSDKFRGVMAPFGDAVSVVDLRSAGAVKVIEAALMMCRRRYEASLNLRNMMPSVLAETAALFEPENLIGEKNG